MAPPIVGYWDIRGLGQYIRNLLVYKGVHFEDKRYRFGPAPDYDRSDWLREKFTLGLKFPNLPYYIDGKVKITQSLAIMRYLGRKYDMSSKNDAEALELDVLEQQAKDLTWGLIMTLFNPNFEDARKKYEDTMDSALKPWAEHMQGKQWVLGDRLTYVDFILYEALDWLREFKAGAFGKHAILLEYLTRFENLPNIKDYMESYKYNRWPILSPAVKWGYRKE
ncbi:glutathione S-transferase-like [Ornithodoros turicata]|uniref:glutathione S-transferase-like n=1 Tax=Ornithodoros turicata TaxID=34597 RepID=UPI003139689B